MRTAQRSSIPSSRRLLALILAFCAIALSSTANAQILTSILGDIINPPAPTTPSEPAVPSPTGAPSQSPTVLPSVTTDLTTSVQTSVTSILSPTVTSPTVTTDITSATRRPIIMSPSPSTPAESSTPEEQEATPVKKSSDKISPIVWGIGGGAIVVAGVGIYAFRKSALRSSGSFKQRMNTNYSNDDSLSQAGLTLRSQTSTTMNKTLPVPPIPAPASTVARSDYAPSAYGYYEEYPAYSAQPLHAAYPPMTVAPTAGSEYAGSTVGYAPYPRPPASEYAGSNAGYRGYGY
ncbi:hypothetical protein BC832DRAFT_335470 [Gaertneriomyces semiglobifer]|nr:hypothetical protein BC832DRAFT_335470 [Gaertneriomyces semiglobifer]